jgi:Ca2+/Na+ antiporter
MKTLDTLEILAVISILFIIFKFAIFALNPRKDIKFSKKFYSKTSLIKLISLVLALSILYILIDSGLTIIDILAVTLFLALVIVVGIIDYTGEFVKKIKSKKFLKKKLITKDFIKKEFLYFLIWLFLIGWGIKVIFF